MKTKIGIPRFFLYYKYSLLWKNFFKSLNCQLILSPESSEQLIKKSEKYTSDKVDLFSKLYLGHVSFLENNCDYIILPILKVSEQLEGKINTIYTIINNNVPNDKILSYKINTNGFNEFIEFIKLGLKIKKNIFKIILSYIKAKIKEKRQEEVNEITQNRKLNNEKTKVLIVSQLYDIYDKYLSRDIIKKLDDNGIQIIYTDKLSKKTKLDYSIEFSNGQYCEYIKELIGALNYYQEIYDGIIFLSTFTNEYNDLIKKIPKINKHILNLRLEVQNKEMYLEEELNKFIKILKEKRNN